MTQKEILVKKIKGKVIELFGPESALAQACEDEGFIDKLGDFAVWLYGEVMLSQEPVGPAPRGPLPGPSKPSPGGPQPWVIPTPAPTKWDKWYTKRTE